MRQAGASAAGQRQLAPAATAVAVTRPTNAHRRTAVGSLGGRHLSRLAGLALASQRRQAAATAARRASMLGLLLGGGTKKYDLRAREMGGENRCTNSAATVVHASCPRCPCPICCLACVVPPPCPAHHSCDVVLRAAGIRLHAQRARSVLSARRPPLERQLRCLLVVHSVPQPIAGQHQHAVGCRGRQGWGPQWRLVAACM